MTGPTNVTSTFSSPPDPPRQSNSSSSAFKSPFEYCLWHEPGIRLMVSYVVLNTLLLLPVYVLVLHMGQQRWRKQRSGSGTSTMSHSDVFTYNMVTMEIVGLAGCGLFCWGFYIHDAAVLMAGVYMYSITTPGQTMFHVFTCLERFVAVVYPVTYLRLKKGGGVKVRNVLTVYTWLICLLGMAVIQETIRNSASVMAFSFWVCALVCIIFFSLSVICVLIRPRPGDGERADQSKKRAFNTIMVILGVLIMRCLGFLLSCVIFSLVDLSLDDKCMVLMTFSVFAMPSSLLLPLLFLQRAGKLPDCRKHPESG